MLRTTTVAAVVAIAVSAGTPTLAHAAAPARWGALAAEIAAPWPDLQNEDGTYRDYVYGGGISFCAERNCYPGFGNSRYAESVLGFALLQTGLRTGDQALIDTGLRSISYIVGRTDLREKLQTNFETWAIASAYNLARASIPTRPLFAENRARWEKWLKTVKPLLLLSGDRRYFNHHLVEAVATDEVIRTGLRSKAPGAVLNPPIRKRVQKVALDIVNREVHGIAAQTAVHSSGDIAEILSDRPEYPLAYQGFSLGFYARAIERLGHGVTDRSRELLRRMARASWLLTAPDGDLAYAGRSHEEAWALAMTAYGAEVAARLDGLSLGERARYHALADRAMRRLDASYPVGPQGMWIVPGLARDPVRGIPALDTYAGAAIFNGLTLIFTEWARKEAGVGKRASGQLASDSDGARRINRGEDTTVTLRRGSLWFAIRQASDFQRRPDDLRNDFGLVALERQVGGRWRHVIPQRPKTETADRYRPDSAGPLLLTGAEPAVPFGQSISAGLKAVTVTGGWRTRGNQHVRTGVRFEFQSIPDCGVRLRFPVNAGDQVEYDVFTVGDPEDVSIAGGEVTDGRQRVTYSEQPADVRLDGGYVSASDGPVTRVRATFAAGDARTIAITTCGA
jgi:hypothetical protein